MSRLLFLLLALALLTPAIGADDIPDPATLPEKETKGDSPATYPAECARRLLAGKALLEKGDLEKAQVEFAEAEKADIFPILYFYEAVLAYRLGDYPTALRKADSALGMLQDVYAYGYPTPETDRQKKRFEELRAAIQVKFDATGGKAVESPEKLKRESAAALKEGDGAYSQGLLAKAANAYARVFRLDPAQGEIGLRAATLYADRLKNPLEAARLWQQVLAGGEPHASTARAELQSHRDALDAVLKAGLAKREQWRRSLNDTEPLQLAEAFPESAELELELAVIYARKGPVDDMIKHLQSASRLGMSADDFLARKEFVDYLQTAGIASAGGQRLASFARDAYGEETLATVRTELKRRVDETARIAREKTEAERQAKRAKELKELNAWREQERQKGVQEINALIGNRDGIEVEMAELAPLKKKRTTRFTMTRKNSLTSGSGQYRFTFSKRSTVYRFSTGSVSPTLTVELITLPSFANLRGIEAWPCSWEDVPQRIGEPNPAFPTFALPADPTHRALAKEVHLAFNGPANIRCKSTTTYEYPTSDGSTGYGSNSDSDTAIDIDAMLTDDEVARLKVLFGQLATLDQAGDNVEKLRQLKRREA